MKRLLRSLVKDPKHWRGRAHEMRSVAAQVNDPKIKAATSGAPDAYENLAQLCEVVSVALGQLEETRTSGEVQAGDSSG
jgi:hypothetical protein